MLKFSRASFNQLDYRLPDRYTHLYLHMSIVESLTFELFPCMIRGRDAIYEFPIDIFLRPSNKRNLTMKQVTTMIRGLNKKRYCL